MLNTCGASRDCDVIRTYLSDVNYPREGIQVKKMITGGLALATFGLAIAACGGSNGNAVGHAAGDTTQQNSAAAPSQPSSAPASGTVPGYPNVSLTGSPASITIPQGSCDTFSYPPSDNSYDWVTVTITGVRGTLDLTEDGDSNPVQIPFGQLVAVNAPVQGGTESNICNPASSGGPVTITAQATVGSVVDG